MEYALLFALMGTWMLYREFRYWMLQVKFREATELVALLSLDKLGKSEGILKIEVLERGNKDED